MKKVHLWVIVSIVSSIALMTIFTSSCTSDNTEPSSPCGTLVPFSELWRDADFSNLSTNKYYEGNTAVYSFIVPTFDPVCALKHAKVEFFFYIKTENTPLITIYADVTYGFFWEYPVSGWQRNEQTNGFTEFKGTADVGMQHAFGEEDGWFFPYAEVKFESLGFGESDDNFFRENVDAITMIVEYYRPK